MLEFLFGWILGVWCAQQFTLPSVHNAVKKWWNSNPSVTSEDTTNPTEEDHETTPIFSGDMPPIDS